jgi:hypothetical protein
MAGRFEGEFAAAVSCTGLLAYTYFPYHDIEPWTNAFTTALIFAPPLLFLLWARKPAESRQVHA